MKRFCLEEYKDIFGDDRKNKMAAHRRKLNANKYARFNFLAKNHRRIFSFR